MGLVTFVDVDGSFNMRTEPLKSQVEDDGSLVLVAGEGGGGVGWVGGG
jgi:hypothetical protein